MAMFGGENGVLAIDIGGTKTRVALVRDARVIEAMQVPTVSSLPVDEWFGVIREAAEKWAGRYARARAAVGGIVRGGRWFAINPKNLPVPEGYPIREKLQGILLCPVSAMNDAQAAAWGEFRFGAGCGRDMAYLTLSTGVGGGFVSGGRLITGSGGLAGHIGQMRVFDPRSEETLESVASGRGIEAAAVRVGRNGSAAEVFEAMRRGKEWAEAIIEKAAEALVIALRTARLLVDCERVVLGGSVGLAQGMADHIGREMRKLPELYRSEIHLSRLGHDAGVLGAADMSLTEAIDNLV